MRSRISRISCRVAVWMPPCSGTRITGTWKAMAGICWSCWMISCFETMRQSPGSRCSFLIKTPNWLWLNVRSLIRLQELRAQHGINLFLAGTDDDERLRRIDIHGLIASFRLFPEIVEEHLNRHESGFRLRTLVLDDFAHFGGQIGPCHAQSPHRLLKRAIGETVYNLLPNRRCVRVAVSLLPCGLAQISFGRAVLIKVTDEQSHLAFHPR